MAKAITLLESTRADHRALGDELLTALLPHTGKAFRLGLSGVPGVGKSTFIEALGLYLIAQGRSMAERSTREAIETRQATDDYIRGVAGSSSVDEIAKAKSLFDAGAITAEEFADLKRRALQAG